MLKVRTFTMMVASLAVLSACEHVHHDTVNDQNSEDKVLMSGPPPSPGAIDGSMPAPERGVTQLPAFPNPTNRDLVKMTNKLAGGDIEIYDVREAPAVEQTPARPQAVGLPSMMEPNVTVFPLSDNGPYPGQYTLQGNAQMWPNAVLPQASGVLTPSYGGYPSDRADTQIYFKHGSSRLSPRDKQAIDAAAEKAKFAPVSRIHVDGHASKRAETGDPVRNSILNLKESMNRAFEVSKEMMLQGVPSEKIKTTAWGDSNQAPSTPEDQARRVDIYPGSSN